MITDVTVEAYSVYPSIFRYDILLDTVSDGYGLVQTCGDLQYTVVDLADGQPPDDYLVSIWYRRGQTFFDIRVDPLNVEVGREVSVALLAELVDYPMVPRFEHVFTVRVIEGEAARARASAGEIEGETEDGLTLA